jgi:hypothetical protein
MLDRVTSISQKIENFNRKADRRRLSAPDSIGRLPIQQKEL